MEFEKCYLFEPEGPRPAKRRRIQPPGLQASWDRRHEAYRNAWATQQRKVDETLNKINAAAVADVSAFLEEAATTPRHAARIPTAIVLAGPGSASHRSVIANLSRAQSGQHERAIVSLSASSGTNLKALLKALIQTVTVRGVDEDDEELSSHAKGHGLLNYDLQILCDHVQERHLRQITIVVEEVEAFENDLLSEFIEHLAYWLDRIPLVLLFTLATSIEVLQQRLTKQAVKSLVGRIFTVAPAEAEVEHVFQAITEQDSPLWVGPNLMSACLERQSDYIQSIGSFVDSLQYAYMACFYANAVSLFLDSTLRPDDIPTDHFEAVRNLPSFRAFCRQLLRNNETTRLQDLLESDKVLYGLVRQRLSQGRDALADIMTAVRVLQELQNSLPGQAATPKSKLYVQALAGKLDGSNAIRSLLLSIKKAPSTTAKAILDVLLSLENPEDVRTRCVKLAQELQEVSEKQSDTAKPLRSEDDIQNMTLRTTVVAQKVELSKQKSSLSKEDAAYTAVLRKLTDLLDKFFAEKLIDPKSLVFHEIFLYDLKSPHREVFSPRPRHAIERALATPHDYLDCECCDPGREPDVEATLAASQPATAVLYQLYLESGTLINASDLLQAFRAVMGDERSDEETVTLFQRALAELHYLGMVKSTRKRADHIAKVAWRGL